MSVWDKVLSDFWKLLRIIIYCRVSSDEQKRYGVSMTVQLARLKDYLQKKGVTKYDICIIDEGKSASSIKHRKGYQQIMQNLDNYDLVLCTSLDRWTRNLTDFLIGLRSIEEHSTVLYSIDEHFDYRENDQRLLMVMKVAMSEYAVHETSKKVKDVHTERFDEGRLLSRAPLGFKIIKDGSNRAYDIAEGWQERMDFIFDQTILGTSYKVICSTVRYEIMRNGKVCMISLSPTSYYHIIRNPIYKGYMTYRNVVKKVEGMPIMIDEERWNKANAVLNQKMMEWR